MSSTPGLISGLGHGLINDIVLCYTFSGEFPKEPCVKGLFISLWPH
jgi:hypothetical protein